MTNLLFIVNKLSVGGAEKHTVCLINGLDEERFGSSLVLLKPVTDLVPEIEPGRLRDLISLDVRSRFDRRAMRRLARYIDDACIDIIVCVDFYPMIYAFFCERMASRRCRRVVIVHQTELAGRYERFKMHAYKHLFKRFEQTVFVSQTQREHWIRDEGLVVRDPQTILNGIDVEHFSNAALGPQPCLRETVSFAGDALVVGICAALRPHKRHVDVVEAVAKLKDRKPSVCLLIIGDGVERANIERRAAQLGIAKRVHVTGFQHDVRPFVSACDCMVIASIAVETFSIAVLESMAMSKPVISTRIGGVEEQIEHGVSGLIYEKGDIDALAAHIESMADGETRRRMGEQARDTVSEHFTVQAMLQRYEAMFEEPPS